MTSILPNSRRPDLTVNISGRIDITARVARLLNLQPGDVIDVSVSGPEYYLYVRHLASEIVGRHEGKCFATRPTGRGSLRTWSVRLAKALRAASGSRELIVRFPCGDPVIIDNKIHIPIIIHNLL